MRGCRWVLVVSIAAAGPFVASAGQAAAQKGPAAAQPASQDLILPGGVAGLSRVLGFDVPLSRARVILEAIRLTYPSVHGVRREVSERQDRLQTYFPVVARFRNAWQALPLSEGRITLKAAETRDGRARLDVLLDVLGLRLRNQKGTWIVERMIAEEALSRRQALTDAGVDLDALERELFAFRPVAVTVPVDTVPLPLGPQPWRRVIFQREVPPDELCGAILSDRAAALLYHGLASLDPDTQAFLSSDPDTLRQMYTEDAGVFATTAEAFHVRGRRVQVPGGTAAEPLWERLVGESTDRPSRFLRRVMSGDEGRLAYFYDTLAHLNPPGQRFALGALIVDARTRFEHFRALYDAFSAPLVAWKPAERPFSRVGFDGAHLFAELTVTEDGALAAPAWYKLWEAAFQDISLPEAPGRLLGDMRGGTLMAAAPLVARVAVVDPDTRRERVEAVLFAQRVFGAASESAAPDILVALRGFVRYPALMLTLERLGITDPMLYARAARHAARLAAIGDPKLAATTLAEFQGALALVERARVSRVLDVHAACAQVISLLNVMPSKQGYYAGQMAQWLTSELLPALADATGTLRTIDNREHIVLLALAGARSGHTAGGRSVEPPRFRWEEREYRLDLAAPELSRLERVRKKQGGNGLDSVLEYARHALALAAGVATVDDARTAAAELDKIAAGLKQPERIGLPQGGPLPDLAEVTSRAVNDVARLRNVKDLGRLPDVGWPLVEMADSMLAEVLPSLAYAASIGDSEGPALAAGNVAVRHDLGLTTANEDLRVRLPFAVPAEQAELGATWHLTGSFLALDVGLASLAPRRLVTDRIPQMPRLDQNELAGFNESIVLTNARDLTDQERETVLAAIEKGRQRVRSAATDPAVAGELSADPRLDGWRTGALPWLAREEPGEIPGWFSLAELFWLGSGDLAVPGGIDGWGPAARAASGCLCTRFPLLQFWASATGREGTALLSTRLADLKLRIAEVLAASRLPSALMPGVLAVLTDEFVGEAAPAHRDDWLTLASQAQAIPQSRIEDCIAALAAGGPMVPVTEHGAGGPPVPRGAVRAPR